MSFMVLVLAWITYVTLFVGYLAVIGVLASERDVSGTVLCVAVPPMALVFAIVRMNKTIVPLFLLAIGLSGLVILTWMQRFSP